MAFCVFPVKSILPMQTTFAHTGIPSFYHTEKKSLTFYPLNGIIIFHGHHYANLPGLVSFCFSSVKLIFFEGIVFVYSFAGGIFTGTYLNFTRVTCTFSNFFRKEIIFTWKNTAYAYVYVFFKTSGNSLRSVSGSGSDPYSRSGSGSGSDKF